MTTQALTYAATVSFPGALESVGRARNHLREALADHPDLDTAVLVTSELVANAVEHSRSGLPGGRVTVRIVADPGTTRIEVIDDGPIDGMPHLADVADDADDAETGRGLLIVQASAPWGTDKRDGQTVVWFELDAKP